MYIYDYLRLHKAVVLPASMAPLVRIDWVHQKKEMGAKRLPSEPKGCGREPNASYMGAKGSQLASIPLLWRTLRWRDPLRKSKVRKSYQKVNTVCQNQSNSYAKTYQETV